MIVRASRADVRLHTVGNVCVIQAIPDSEGYYFIGYIPAQTPSATRPVSRHAQMRSKRKLRSARRNIRKTPSRSLWKRRSSACAHASRSIAAVSFKIELDCV